MDDLPTNQKQFEAKRSPKTPDSYSSKSTTLTVITTAEELFSEEKERARRIPGIKLKFCQIIDRKANRGDFKVALTAYCATAPRFC